MASKSLVRQGLVQAVLILLAATTSGAGAYPDGRAEATFAMTPWIRA